MPGSQPSRVGTRFGPYELRSLLGRGGMGEVYSAYDTVKDRTVALKLLPVGLASDPAYQERFRREARTAARLQEPHVIPIHDFGEIDGVLFIDMRLVDGRDLRSVLRAEGRLVPTRAVSILAQVAAALDAAHADGLVHRDVKPENVLLTGDSFAYLADFGIASRDTDAKLTEHGSAIGSMAYMAPERFDDAPVTPRADVYSLGCVLHECLVGATPYPARTVSAQIRAHLYDVPPAASQLAGDVPRSLDAVIGRALAKDPSQRYPTAGDLMRAAAATLGVSVGSFSYAPSEEAGDAETVTWSGPPPAEAVTSMAATGRADLAGQEPTSSRLPVSPAPARSRKPVLVSALAAVVLAVGVALGWSLLPRGSNATSGVVADDRQPASVGLTGPATSASASQSAASSVPAPVTTSASSTPSSTSSSSTSPSSASTTSTPTGTSAIAGAGYDGQGWQSSTSARCNYIDPAVLVAESVSARIVICETGAGGYYYRAYQTKNGNAIEISFPTRTTSGWQATNKGVTYDLTSSSLTISKAGKVLMDEAMLVYDEG